METDRDAAIEYLYTNGLGTLRSIGKRCGISGERVRQILVSRGLDERGFRRKLMVDKIRKEATNHTATELSKKFRVSKDTISRVTGDIRKPLEKDASSASLGRDGEDFFIASCLSRDLKTVPQLIHSPFDVLVNGYRVDVKTAFSETVSKSRREAASGSIWGFGSSKRDAEIYAFIIFPLEAVFIVPVRDMPKSEKTYRLYITWPTDHYYSKYRAFHEAWHFFERRDKNGDIK